MGDDGGGRVKLTGQGPTRMHCYRRVRADYYEQLLSEVKAPSRRFRHKKTWQKKSGMRNEVLDCDILALHVSRSVRVHLAKPRDWDLMEQRLMQSDLFSEENAAVQTPRPKQSPPNLQQQMPPPGMVDGRSL